MEQNLNSAANQKATDPNQEMQQILARKLEKTLKFKRFFSGLEQNMNGATSYKSEKGDEKKSPIQLDVERLQNEITAKEKARAEAAADPKRAMDIEANYSKPQRVGKGDKKYYLILGLALIFWPYAMGIGIVWAAPLGLALIALPYAVTAVTKVIEVFAKARAKKLLKKLNLIREDDQNSRTDFVVNDDKTVNNDKEEKLDENNKDNTETNENKNGTDNKENKGGTDTKEGQNKTDNKEKTGDKEKETNTDEKKDNTTETKKESNKKRKKTGDKEKETNTDEKKDDANKTEKETEAEPIK